MIVITCVQGTPEWHAARAGVITASMFSTATKRLKTGPNKGDFSEAGKNYAFRVAIERISGEPLDEGFETWSMKRGHELEDEARICHENDIGELVDLAGFVTTDDSKFGCSADALINPDGGGEYKCFVAPEKLRGILMDGDLTDVVDQIQGCMWITGATWWDFCLYCPALEKANKHFTRIRVDRDDSYIETMEQELVKFESLVSEYEALLRAGGDKPEVEPEPESEPEPEIAF